MDLMFVAVLNDQSDPDGNGTYSGHPESMIVAANRTAAERWIAEQYAAGRGAARYYVPESTTDPRPQGSADILAAVGDHERFAARISYGSGQGEPFACINQVGVVR